MNKTHNQLSVRLYGQPVGVLEQHQGKMSFSYLSNTQPIISLSMQDREKEYSHEICDAYFGGLLPEGDLARKAIGSQFKVNHNDSFSLLKVIGHDCAGAVSLLEMNEPVLDKKSFPLKGRVLTEKELAKHIQELPKKPLFIGVDGLRLSLAGVQDKAAVCLIDNQIAIPTEASITTHILKPAINQYADTVFNEYFCLSLAKKIGLNVPALEIREANGILYLLIERYDRKILTNGYLERVHQEDFCQALGISSLNKYQSESGPGLKECFKLLNQTHLPAVERSEFMKRVIFNYLIGNNDAHAKNFSLLYSTPKGALSPMYDVLCTTLYEDLTDKMAMKIGLGKNYNPEKIFPRHWEEFCNQVEFSYPIFKKQLQEICEKILPEAEIEMQSLLKNKTETSNIKKIILKLQQNIKRVKHRFNI